MACRKRRSMGDDKRQNPGVRSQLKCFRCREKKVKCTPSDRRWEETRQKCDNCQRHNEHCGPNRKARDKRTRSRSRNNHAAHGDDNVRDPGQEPRTPASQPTGSQQSGTTAGEGSEEQLSMVAEVSRNSRKRKFASTDEELVDEANRRLEKLNSSGRAHDLASRLTTISCRNPPRIGRYNNHPDGQTHRLKEIFRLQFVGTCRLGFQLYERGKNGDAGRIFLKLNSALQRYSGIGDNYIHHALWEMARFFEETGDKDEYELVLIKIAETYIPSIRQPNPHRPLATSLDETSKRTNDDLLEFWKEHYMVSGETSLAVPPIQQLAQLRRTDVRSILQLLPNSFERSRPALSNLEGLHIAAADGEEEILVALLEAGFPVDALDVHRQTALFLAALNGHDGCCAQLIERGADSTHRNIHGNTILEVAARAGHIEIVKRLVLARAEINPDLVCCCSSPLQAAIEGAKSPLELATYLIDQGADMSVQRWDGKTALDLADNRDRHVASYIRQMQMQGPQDFFNQRQVYSDWTGPPYGPALV